MWDLISIYTPRFVDLTGFVIVYKQSPLYLCSYLQDHTAQSFQLILLLFAMQGWLLSSNRSDTKDSGNGGGLQNWDRICLSILPSCLQTQSQHRFYCLVMKLPHIDRSNMQYALKSVTGGELLVQTEYLVASDTALERCMVSQGDAWRGCAGS